MIFYFSGTGNSLQVARSLAENNGEKLVSIAAAVNGGEAAYEYTLDEEEMVGFVYPVYAWAPPKMVFQFIEGLKLNNYRNNYTFSVATCGENIGKTMEVLADALKNKGIGLDSGFSIAMPNNYIIMGDVDTKEAEERKLAEAEETLKTINRVIRERKRGVFDIKKGFLPWVLTSVINPLFNKNAIDTSKFHADDSCNGCGLCERVCNCRSIKVEGKPRWGEKCTQCLACIHYCPMKAIQYGKGTEKKGRYTNPNVKISER
ncbi:MAG TPA: EFR1 family ferrodoxin [Candidatus Nitrosocosmicus sp.]|nr:EFR1 family ferrodoxin [Candidatus Nitrosocosmicus sp.]